MNTEFRRKRQSDRNVLDAVIPDCQNLHGPYLFTHTGRMKKLQKNNTGKNTAIKQSQLRFKKADTTPTK